MKFIFAHAPRLRSWDGEKEAHANHGAQEKVLLPFKGKKTIFIISYLINYAHSVFNSEIDGDKA